MSEKLNKLQIRAKVLEIIKSYKSEDELNSNFHDFNLKTLRDLNENKFVVEILLKELVSSEELELSAVKVLLTDFATLDMVEETIWTLLKDKNIPDKHKERYLNLLRFMGGKIDVSVLMECMDNFDSVVDEQTLELLQDATVNPEAQIDFLDFLFSLKSTEQIQLITSLEDDFKGDELASILSPGLKVKLDDNVKSSIISILAHSNSYFAVKPLKNFIAANSDNDLKRLALKALNQLKSAGLDIENDEILTLRDKEVCNGSVFYKAFLSQVDGCGNQGLIFSRINDKKQIVMFSTVINVTDGIIDCFGLHNIPITDFQKVITRFKDNDLVVPVSAENAKYILSAAEKLNEKNTNTSPYEYVCWSIYLADIDEVSINYDELVRDNITSFTSEIYSKLYDTEMFDSWFFEYDDNIYVQNLIDYTVTAEYDNIDTLYENIEYRIDEIFNNVFTEEKISEYSQMLKNAGYVFSLNNCLDVASISVNLSNAVLNSEKEFLKDILRRSVLQYLADITAGDEKVSDNVFGKSDDKPLISEEKAFDLLNALEERWSNKNV